jgi:hypothetical protein
VQIRRLSSEDRYTLVSERHGCQRRMRVECTTEVTSQLRSCAVLAEPYPWLVHIAPAPALFTRVLKQYAPTAAGTHCSSVHKQKTGIAIGTAFLSIT